MARGGFQGQPGVSGDLDELLLGDAVDVLPEGAPRRAARRGQAAAGQARHRPDHRRHPPRPHGRAREAARVPGRRPHGGPDHRRLHRPGRRPERALERSGRCSTPEEIEANAATYQEQAFKVLDRERTEVRFNSEWLGWTGQELLELLAQTTVARLLERDDFQKRMQAGAADRGARAALPAAAGLRLGGGRGRRRARRDRPEVQPALRPRRPERLRPAAAVDPDDADPGRAPTACRR